ncbi:unnamed protein product [Calicophoron daubneyi]|uniref:N-acetylgalactosaminide beta-1,3-galactosyltransferase n=1 Tax=Calicophoron daubneyi TaxID=300641 RepID=A0AAV2SX96_CALDB
MENYKTSVHAKRFPLFFKNYKHLERPGFGASGSGVENEGRNSLWDKTKFGIREAVKHFDGKFDYFFKADDDTYVIMENLRKLLMDQDPNEPFVMGKRFKPFAKQGYLSGGAGYVISRAGLQRIAEGLNTNSKCGTDHHTWAEDVVLGACAEATGVKTLDSLDEFGRERFHPFDCAFMLNEAALNATTWFANYSYHQVKGGKECCSDYSVTFHYVNPGQMYVYDFFLYHLHPYGIFRDYNRLIKLMKNNLPTVR